MTARSDTAAASEWWRTAVVYQVYIRSFADGSGDGIGDIAGLRSRLPYLRQLGVDAIWINPWYPSPQIDAGYDVADYRDIEPAYGDLAGAEALLKEAHRLGLRVILDIVPNHTSWDHPWFKAALAGDEDARARYLFRPGKGADGELPPNNWLSAFGGPAWTRTTGTDGRPGDWYLHLFAPAQPDLDWSNPEVVEEFEAILRFWFDKGVDGFRIDVAHGLVKDPTLPDATADANAGSGVHPAWDQDGVHQIYRGWRRVAEDYPDRVFVAEAWVESNARLGRYLRPDELHTAFQFDFLEAPFVAAVMRSTIDDARTAAAEVSAPSTWVLSNHDVIRVVTRYARSQPDEAKTSAWLQGLWATEPADIALGIRRARAAALLTLGLPGTVYLYQGDELGLPEYEDIPADRRQDPTFVQTAGERLGRDGCRVPLPWSGERPPYGFGGADTWLPQPDDWADYTAASEDADPASTLNLYRRAIALRGEHLVGSGSFAWLESPEGAFAFDRGTLQVWVNVSADPVPLPGRVLISSVPLEDGRLPQDAAAWVAVS